MAVANLMITFSGASKFAWRRVPKREFKDCESILFASLLARWLCGGFSVSGCFVSAGQLPLSSAADVTLMLLSIPFRAEFNLRDPRGPSDITACRRRVLDGFYDVKKKSCNFYGTR